MTKEQFHQAAIGDHVEISTRGKQRGQTGVITYVERELYPAIWVRLENGIETWRYYAYISGGVSR